jgi:pimeloyl-ACP methyl ester carboxylesterase
MCQFMFPKGDPFLRQEIPVGPPPASIAVMELPPANYHVTVTTKVSQNKLGKKTFSLWLLPDTNAVVTPLPEKGTLVLLHGYFMQKEAMLPWALELAQTGWRVVLVDVRGHGHSTGTNFFAGKIETRDMMQVLDYLSAHKLCGEQVGVLGYSFGADLALYWAVRDVRVKTIVAIAAYDQPDEAIIRFAQDMKLPFSEPRLRAAAAIAAKKIGLNWADWSGSSAARQIKVPVFFIGAQKDKVSPAGDMVALKQAASPGCKFLQVNEGNHETIGYWLQELTVPVEAWFQEKVPAKY